MTDPVQNVEEMEQDNVVQEPDSQTAEDTSETKVEEDPKAEEEHPKVEDNPKVTELEKKFEDRYTESDPAFKAVVESKEASPPVVQNFGSHSRDDDRHRKRSRSKSPTTLKRKGMFDCFSYFVYYY